MQSAAQYGAPFSHRTIWILWIFLVLGALLFAFIGTYFGKSPRTNLESWDWVVVAMAVYSMWSSYWFRALWPKRQAICEKLTPERRWSITQLISFSCAESIVLWGVFANMSLGSPRWLPYTLYAVGILLLLAFAPLKKPEVS